MPQPNTITGGKMSHEFIDKMMEQTKAGELRSPVSETLGMHLVESGRGEAVYEMDAREELGNPLGVIQGGVVTALADAAMAAATTTILTDEEIQKSAITTVRSEEHTSELQSLAYLVCRLLLEKKKLALRVAIVCLTTSNLPRFCAKVTSI